VRAGRGRAAVLGLALAAAACGPKPEPPPPATPSRPPPLLPTFDPPSIDLGTLAAGTRLERSVLLRDETDQPVRVVDLEASCECTTTDVTLPVQLRPGDAVTVPLVVDLGLLTRGGAPAAGEPSPVPIAREVTAVTADGGRATLAITGAVSSAVRLEPATLLWADAAAGAPLKGEVAVRGADALPPPVKEVISRGSPPPEVARRDEDGAVVIEVSWGPFPEPGEHRGSLVIVTGSADVPRVEVPLRAEVVGPVVASPAEIVEENAVPTRPVVETLTLRRRDGQPVRVLSATCTEHRVTVEVLPEQVHVPEARVRVIVPVLPHPRQVVGAVEVTTDVAGGTVRVPVRVRALPPA